MFRGRMFSHRFKTRRCALVPRKYQATDMLNHQQQLYQRYTIILSGLFLIHFRVVERVVGCKTSAAGRSHATSSLH
jgi:hypothetical protein